MAKQKPANLSGKISNLVFYEVNGETRVRTHAKKVRQSKATKASSGRFGQAATICKALRYGIEPLLSLGGTKKNSLMYRLNAAVSKWLAAGIPKKGGVTMKIPFIDKFEFNEKSELSARLRKLLPIDWSSNNKITLTIPELEPWTDIFGPLATTSVCWKIGAVRTDVKERAHVTAVYKTEIELPFRKDVPSTLVVLDISPKTDELLIVAVALSYKVKKKGSIKLNQEERWLPGGIVGVCYGKPA